MRDGLCDRAPFEAVLLIATSASLCQALSNANLPGAATRTAQCDWRCMHSICQLAWGAAVRRSTEIHCDHRATQWHAACQPSSLSCDAVSAGAWASAAGLAGLTAAALQQELRVCPASQGAVSRARPAMQNRANTEAGAMRRSRRPHAQIGHITAFRQCQELQRAPAMLRLWFLADQAVLVT